MSIIKKEFVRRILLDEANRFEKNQGLQMQKLLHFHTNNLFSGREFKVEAGDHMDGQLRITHVVYQRFLDLKRKTANGKAKRRIPIHNKFAFGHYYSIANRLMNDFTRDVAEGIKRDLLKK